MADGQLGYRGKAYRGASQIPNVRSITPPEPTRERVDVTHLESPSFTRENIAGFIDLPEATYEAIHVEGNAIQDLIEEDFYDGLQTSEEWSHQICHPETGVTQRTYTYDGYIASALRGPIATEEVIILTVRIQLTGAVVIT